MDGSRHKITILLYYYLMLSHSELESILSHMASDTKAFRQDPIRKAAAKIMTGSYLLYPFSSLSTSPSDSPNGGLKENNLAI